MPTQSTTYNSRVTDEALEKRFRDTFRSQGGSELVDDLYAQGVIVPVVDFTAAATGQQLAENLQTAWDSSTGTDEQNGSGTSTAISNAGFWKVFVQGTMDFSQGGGAAIVGSLEIFDGTTAKTIWTFTNKQNNFNEIFQILDNLTVFLRSGDSLRLNCTTGATVSITYRQIATVNGDLVNPTGFTSS